MKFHEDPRSPEFNSLHRELKMRIMNNEDTKSDRLLYAKLQYNKARSGSLSRFNPFKRLSDVRTFHKDRFNRIIAGKHTNDKDHLVDHHAEVIAEKLKSKAAQKFNENQELRNQIRDSKLTSIHNQNQKYDEF